ncbi:hypothetical protein TSTA_031520 [Talaromyces stipitatus ATCC 10500]|uniref:F-box domain-containing protein n=1 Tax=Talaromyces stipitatus (strain ATCC 10500 / CBS 375.48 / QM 6759 / NRRL 1006) TaxID=441959 RepID=B8M5J9_TALSN|nr:uncharacterized protein TSTA_031520 [Talaromyces stipitatus ATCC 10500]EED19893.1 hypothetical protein TSTA_031520 [Talaromyces stipitatus ATCC 10500]
MAEYVGSTRDAESRSLGPDDWPGDSFQKIVHELEQTRYKVASLHGSMREAANASSRSRIRSLNILDLPDELLRAIFEQSRKRWVSTENYFFIPDYGNWEGIKDIKNIRLTCRRFCNTSSHLLLRHIDVSMRPSSLAHLEEVARHPLLSKGIQAVRVHLNYFSAHLATDMFHFTALAIMHLEDTLDFYRFDFERDSDEQPFDIPREKLGPAIEKAELILEEWSEFLNVLRDSDGDPDIIEEEIAKSREVAGLESVLKDGAFVQAIVTAMSKMPTAKKLFVGDLFRDFEDGRRNYVKPFVDAVEDPEGLAAVGTVRALDWDAARSKQLDDQPKEILLQLLMTVFDNHIPINYLCIELSPAADLSIPATQEQLQQLAAGMEHLRVFDFRGSASQTGGGPIVDHGPEQIASFGSLISACMGGKALTRLDVYLSFALDDFAPQPPVSMGSLLVSRHCPNLETLRLSHFPLHLSELKTFIEGLNGPLCINLDNVLLLSGTWTEALDLIRKKANWESFVTRQRGAECDDMSEEETLVIFGKDSFPSFGEEGKATWYVRGSIKDNPLRIREGTSAS